MLAVSNPGHGVDFRRGLRLAKNFAFGHVPNADGFVCGTGNEPGAVGRKIQSIHRTLVAGKISDGLARGRIPQPDTAVVAAGGEPSPIRADSQSEH